MHGEVGKLKMGFNALKDEIANLRANLDSIRESLKFLQRRIDKIEREREQLSEFIRTYISIIARIEAGKDVLLP